MATTSKPQASQSVIVTTNASDTPLLDAVVLAYCEKSETIRKEYERVCANPAMSALHRTMARARTVELLEDALSDDIMKRIMKLMNKKYGFMTDHGPHAWKDSCKKEYDQETVKRCVIQGLLMGLFPVNNEFNILADGQYYPALNGWERKVNEIPGISNILVSPGVPAQMGPYVVIRVGGRWVVNGQSGMLVDENGSPGAVYTIQVNKGSNGDNITGKARCKALRDIYRAAAGKTTEPIPFSDDHDEAAAALEKLNVKVAASGAAGQTEKETIAAKFQAIWKRAVEVGAFDKNGLTALVAREFGGKTWNTMSADEIHRLGERVEQLVNEYERPPVGDEMFPAESGEETTPVAHQERR